ncbi:MAG: hypothetical protein RLZZ292_671 [Bacteroidota bacterium]|jgi:hypothetical protein
MVATSALSKPKRLRKTPDYLIAEVLDGKPLHYKGYKDVLKGKKTLEEIMGSSSLQAAIIDCLLQIIYKFIDVKKYRVHTNEAGLHLKLNDNLSGDILIYDKAVLTADKINTHYANVPPKIDIEIDVNIDLSDMNEMDYILAKTKKLLAFDVEKVIWILSNSQKVFVATPNVPWLIYDWNADIEIMDNNFFNIAAFIEEEGIILE